MLSTILLGLTVLGLGAWVAVNYWHHTSYYRPALYFADKGAVIEVKDTGGKTKTRQETLRDFIEQRCPSLLRDFRPVWWLVSGHLQTAYSVVGDFSKIDAVEYDRTFLLTLDGGTLLYTA